MNLTPFSLSTDSLPGGLIQTNAPEDFKQTFFQTLTGTRDERVSKEVVDIVDHDYDLLIKLLSTYAAGDCTALLVNGEPIWNTYQKLSVRDEFYQNMARSYFIDKMNTYLIPTLIMNRGVGEIKIYMFGNEPLLIKLTYSENSRGFTAEFWCSQAYSPV